MKNKIPGLNLSRWVAAAAILVLCGRGVLFSQTNVLTPGDPVLASSVNPPSLGADNAIDGTEAKYLNFDSAYDAKPSGFVVTPSAGGTVVSGMALESANNAAERDPKVVALEGSNDEAISSFDSGSWNLIVTLTIPSWETVFEPTNSRYQTQTFFFNNTTAYRHYRWTVLHTQGPSDCCMQISEVQLLGSTSVLRLQTITFSLPSELSTTNSPITLTASASSGLPVTFAVLSGAATVNGNQLYLTGCGQVILRALQAGNDQFHDVFLDQTFTVTLGGGVNLPPTVTTASPVVDMDQDSSVVIAYSISDPDSILDLTNVLVISTLSDLVPNSAENILATGGPVAPGAMGTVNVSVKPAVDSVGSVSLLFVLNDGCNYVTNTLTLKVSSPKPPTPTLAIISQPSSIAVEAGANAVFTVVADGTPPITYQWQFTGTNLTGATEASLSLVDVQPAQAGSYSVLVGDVTGTLISTSAMLSVTNKAAERILAGPIFNPATAHHYYLLEASSWTNAELAAIALGGHLVTINSWEENDWVFNTFANFGGDSHDLWVGLFLPDPSAAFTDPLQRRKQFGWSSGQPVTVQMWAETNLFRTGYCKLLGPAGPLVFDRGRWAEEFPDTMLESVVELPAPLEIISQPETISVGIGAAATFAVLADGTSALHYQWQSGGTNLPGETTATLVLTNVQPADSGSFSVVVNNASGSVTSNPAFFWVAGLVGWGSWAPFDTRNDIPSGLTNILAIAAGDRHDLALKSDGTVVAWGENNYNQLSVPSDLTNVVAIAGALYHSLALKADGTVVSWGYNVWFTGNWVPANLANVIAIDANGYHNLALKGDGTVVAWGGDGAQPSVAPSDLTNIVAIAAGGGHNLAIKADGTVVAWADTTGQYLSVPDRATNVVAISAGEGASMALRADGTIVAWSADPLTEFDIPADLTNIVAIAGKFHPLLLKADGTVVTWDSSGVHNAAPIGLPNTVAIASGYLHSLALLRDGAPNLTVQPWDRSVPEGASPNFSAKAAGLQSMNYQWQFNGKDILGATKDNYGIPNVQPVDAGVYSLSVSNKAGVISSRHAKLVVSSVAPIDVKHAPILPSQTSLVIDELTPMVLVNTATDPDNSNDPLLYKLVNPPVGAQIDSAGVIRWTPGEEQGPSIVTITTVVSKGSNSQLSATNSFVVYVNEVNQPPVLPAQVDQTISALSQLTVMNAATDLDIPCHVLSYALVSPPAGATIDSSGAIRWTPDRSQGPGTNVLTTVVTDNGVPGLSATNSFKVIVCAPTLAPINNFNLNPGQVLSFTNLAVDNDHARSLRFSLDTAPVSAAVGSVSGIFSWRIPIERAGTSNYLQLSVTDDSVIPVSDFKGFNVIVNPLQPAILSTVHLSNGTYALQVNGLAGPDYTLQASSNLVNWLNLETSTPASMPFTFANTNQASFPNRFYRVLLSP